MSEETLFELPAKEERPAPAPIPGEARVLRPVRDQLKWATVDLESMLPQEHPARSIWSFLETLDLSAFYEPIKAVENRPGRPTTDPQVVLALWLLATVDGIGSARRLARLCEEHDAYRWMSGHVPINHHMLSDFRVCPPGGVGRPFDPDHRLLDGRWRGPLGACGSRRDAGAVERRRGIFSRRAGIEEVPEGGAGAGGSAGAGARASRSWCDAA